MERLEVGDLHGKLGELEEQLRVLLEHLPNTVVSVLDSELRYVQISKQLSGLGWRGDDVLGKTIDDLLADRPETVERYHAALAGEPQQLRYRSLSGERLYDLQIVPLVRDGVTFGVMSVASDVTSAVEIERLLREAKDEFESAFSYAAIGMALVDLDGSWLSVNRGLCELLGYTEDELLQSTFQDVTHPDDLDADLELVAQLVAGELESYQLEKRYFRKDGSILPVLLSVSLVRDEGGAPVRFISQIQDRTNDVQRRALERELLERRRADALNALAGGLAHDFNNVLVGILGHTSLALGELPEDSPARRHLEQVDASARRIAEVTDQMLAYSGKSWLDLVEVDLGDEARKVCERLRASPGGVELRLSVAPDVPLVRADVAQLDRVLTSLVENALESADGRSPHVGVTVGVLHLTRAALDSYAVGAAADPGRFAYVEVSDDGDGMSEDVLARMFEPFFTTKFQGRGLGLAAVDGLIRAHGGALAALSTPGSGTRLRVFLPAAA